MKKIKNLLKNWYTKPRIFDNFVNWILFDPKSLSILMVMGHIVALILFLVLFILALANWGFVARIFLGLGLALTLWNLIKYVRFQKKTGSIFKDSNLMDMLFNGGRK